MALSHFAGVLLAYLSCLHGSHAQGLPGVVIPSAVGVSATVVATVDVSTTANVVLTVPTITLITVLSTSSVITSVNGVLTTVQTVIPSLEASSINVLQTTSVPTVVQQLITTVIDLTSTPLALPSSLGLSASLGASASLEVPSVSLAVPTSLINTLLNPVLNDVSSVVGGVTAALPTSAVNNLVSAVSSDLNEITGLVGSLTAALPSSAIDNLVSQVSSEVNQVTGLLGSLTANQPTSVVANLVSAVSSEINEVTGILGSLTANLPTSTINALLSGITPKLNAATNSLPTDLPTSAINGLVSEISSDLNEITNSLLGTASTDILPTSTLSDLVSEVTSAVNVPTSASNGLPTLILGGPSPTSPQNTDTAEVSASVFFSLAPPPINFAQTSGSTAGLGSLTDSLSLSTLAPSLDTSANLGSVSLLPATNPSVFGVSSSIDLPNISGSTLGALPTIPSSILSAPILNLNSQTGGAALSVTLPSLTPTSPVLGSPSVSLAVPSLEPTGSDLLAAVSATGSLTIPDLAPSISAALSGLNTGILPSPASVSLPTIESNGASPSASTNGAALIETTSPSTLTASTSLPSLSSSSATTDSSATSLPSALSLKAREIGCITSIDCPIPFYISVNTQTQAQVNLRRRQTGNGVLILDSDGFAKPPVSTLSEAVITGGRLLSTGGGEYSVSIGLNIELFAPSSNLGAIQETFSVTDTIRWTNDSFNGGQAAFCITPSSQVYVVLTTPPSDCTPVVLDVLRSLPGSSSLSSSSTGVSSVGTPLTIASNTQSGGTSVPTAGAFNGPNSFPGITNLSSLINPNSYNKDPGNSSFAAGGPLPSSVLDAFKSGAINFYSENPVTYLAQLCPTCPIVSVFHANDTYSQRPCPVCPLEVMQCSGPKTANQANSSTPMTSGVCEYDTPVCLTCQQVQGQPEPKMSVIDVPCPVCENKTTSIVCPSAVASSVSSLAQASGVETAKSAASSAAESLMAAAITVVAPGPTSITTLPCSTCEQGGTVASSFGLAAPSGAGAAEGAAGESPTAVSAASTVVNVPCSTCPAGSKALTVAQVSPSPGSSESTAVIQNSLLKLSPASMTVGNAAGSGETSPALLTPGASPSIEGGSAASVGLSGAPAAGGSSSPSVAPGGIPGSGSANPAAAAIGTAASEQSTLTSVLTGVPAPQSNAPGGGSPIQSPPALAGAGKSGSSSNGSNSKSISPAPFTGSGDQLHLTAASTFLLGGLLLFMAYQ